MARAVVLTKSLTAAAVAAVAAAQPLAAAGNLLINGSAATGGVATLDSQRRISILSSGNDSALNWTVYGTNQAGLVISEVVAGGNAVAVATTQDFLTVTRISGSGATAGTVQVGTSGIGSTPWQVPNQHITEFSIGVGTELVSGAANWTIEVTSDSPLQLIPIYQPGFATTPPVPVVFGWPGLSGVAAATAGKIDTVIAAWRLTITAGLGTVKVSATQAGIRN